MDDEARWYRKIYEIFDVTPVPPRQFICHDLAPYHEPKPDSPDQVFECKDFRGYLGVLQTLPLDTLQRLEKPLWRSKWHRFLDGYIDAPPYSSPLPDNLDDDDDDDVAVQDDSDRAAWQ